MSRPLYENAESLAAEGHMVSMICSKWKCDAVKLPIKYGADFALERDRKIVALAEMKDRYCDSTIPKLILSLEKFSKGKMYAQEIGVPFFAVFRFKDGIWKYIRLDDKQFDISINGRADRGDKQDIEPVVWLPVRSMGDLKVDPVHLALSA